MYLEHIIAMVLDHDFLQRMLKSGFIRYHLMWFRNELNSDDEESSPCMKFL